MLRKIALLLTAVLVFLPLSAQHPAQASTTEVFSVSISSQIALEAYNWAVTQSGKPYEWGETGPNGYDCSGLVMEAYKHAGIQLPRTTYSMLSSPELEPVAKPVRGDLAFFGSGHVELYSGWYPHIGGWTFGAHESGTRISPAPITVWWHPSAYYRLR
jgi:peptidoglycan DL-endopeptidase CwlO